MRKFMLGIVGMCLSNLSLADDVAEQARAMAAMREAMPLIYYKTVCDLRFPDYEAQTREAFTRWRQQYEPYVSTMMASPDYAAEVTSLKRQVDATATDSRRVQEDQRMCAQVRLQMSTVVSPNDARYATAEKTWALLLQALRSRDRSLAISCYAEGALTLWGVRIEQMPEDDMVRFAEALGQTRVINQSEDEAALQVILKSNKSAFVGLRHIAGNWRIVDMNE